MDSARPSNPPKLIALQEAALKLGVGVDVLLKWNEHNILKPTITLNGEIGYTQAQLDEFLLIRQPIMTPTSLPTPENCPETAEDISSNLSQNEPTEKFTPLLHPPYPKTQLPSPILVSSFVAVFMLLTIAAVIEQGRIKSTADSGQPESQASVLVNQPVFSVPAAFDIAGQNKSLTPQSSSIFAGKFSSGFYRKTTQKSTIPSTQNGQVLASTAAELAKSTQAKVSNDVTLEATAVTDSFPLSSVTEQTAKNTDKSTIDKNGNITGGDTKSNTISLLLGGTNITPSSRPMDTNDFRNQLILLIMGILGIGAFYLRKPQKQAAIAYQNPIKSANSVFQKVLEIDQKMDGTVVLHFQGKIYKVSKPELYSDSDRFIERLMKLVEPGVKEIEYDSWKDEKLKLSAPLSRLVTRLGFVGIKRDLFFPRTSKNRVLFRKYITEQDLAAMSLTVSQIANDLFANI